MTRKISNWLIAAGVALLLAAPLAADETDARAPLPDTAAIRDANKVIDAVYKDDLVAAKSVDLKKALAQKWLKAARETQNDPAGKFALLSRGRDIAADAGDVETALTTVGEIATAYRAEIPAMDADVLTKLIKSAHGPADFKTLARYANGAVNEALVAERWEPAKRLAEIAAAAAGKAEDPALARLSANRPKDVRDAEISAKAVARSQAVVGQQTPDGYKATLEAGRYRFLTLGDAKRGLPLLVQSTDPILRPLAEKDQANPSAGDAMVALADAWWDAADKNQGAAKARMQLRARTWYQEAGQSLTGLPKAKAEQRVKETELTAVVYGPKTLAASSSAGPAPAVETPVAAASASLPQGTYNREWTSPANWAGKPEQVTVSGNKISVTNEGGKNVVYTDANTVKEKDGTITVSWNKSATQMGYEVWTVKGKEITIERWNSKEEKDSGQPARRTGRVTK